MPQTPRPSEISHPIDAIPQAIDQEPMPPRQHELRVTLDQQAISLKCLQGNRRAAMKPPRRWRTGRIGEMRKP